MRARFTLGATLAVALYACSALAAEDATLKSGPQVGSSKISPFNPLHCSGAGAGGRACLV
jgi:hypothetical protein